MSRINIAMLFFSMMKVEKDGCIYVKDEAYELEDTKESEKGFQTNEAPLADILLFLDKKGHGKLDRLYCLVTKETVSEKIGGTDKGIKVVEDGAEKSYTSQFDFWRERIRRRFPALGDTDIVSWPLKYDENVNLVSTIQGQVAALADQIKSDYKERLDKDEFHLYADITGGPRHANMLLTSVIRFLQYDNMQLEKMVYSDKNIFSNVNKVFDVLAVEKLYTLIAGADAFIKYGSSAAIEEYFGYDAEREMIPDKPESQKLAAVLRDMRHFSDAIQICQTAKIPQALGALKESLEQFRNIPAGERTPEDKMFAQLMDTIWDGYKEIFPHDGKDKCDQYLSIIKWCKSKGLLQQAMTLCTEWIPVYMVDKGICAPGDQEIAEKSIDNLHPGWKQNFIINPEMYFRSVKSSLKEYRKACCDAIDNALDGKVVVSILPNLLNSNENRKLLEAVAKIKPCLSAFAKAHGNEDERLKKAFGKNKETRKIVNSVLKRLKKGDDSISDLESLLKNSNRDNLIRMQLKKTKGDSILIQLIGLKGFNIDERDEGINKGWESQEGIWRQMMGPLRLADYSGDGIHTLKCLKAYYLLRSERNQINHATEHNILNRSDVEKLISGCLDVLSERIK